MESMPQEKSASGLSADAAATSFFLATRLARRTRLALWLVIGAELSTDSETAAGDVPILTVFPVATALTVNAQFHFRGFSMSWPRAANLLAPSTADALCCPLGSPL